MREKHSAIRGAHQQGDTPAAGSPNTIAGKLWLGQHYQQCTAQHWFPVKEEEISFPSPSPSPVKIKSVSALKNKQYTQYRQTVLIFLSSTGAEAVYQVIGSLRGL